MAIGEGLQPGEQNGHPRQLDRFVFKRKILQGQDVVWKPATDIAKVHGEKPTELGIIFLNDGPRDVLRTEYAWWTTAGYKCHGEMVQIENPARGLAPINSFHRAHLSDSAVSKGVTGDLPN